MRKALATPRRRGGTRAAVLLDGLTAEVGSFEKNVLPTFLGAMFEIADDLDVDSDEERGLMALGNNHLRL